MIHIILIVAMAFLFSILLWRAHGKQDRMVREIYAGGLREEGCNTFWYRCGYCRKKFIDETEAEVDCPNCRGLVRIRLPRE